MNIIDRVKAFYDLAWGSRLLSLLIFVPAMNMMILLMSIVFETGDYEGNMPLMWLTSTTLAVLTVYEYRKEKKKRLEEPIS